MHFKKARRLTTHAAKVFLMAAMCAGTRGWCQDSTNAPAVSNARDPLLDLLIQKGILTQKEADTVQAEAGAASTNYASQMPPLPPSKWRISNGIKNIELFGMARLRYEDRSAADPAGNSIDLQRWRYALQLGLRGDLLDQFYYGLRLDTGTSPRSDSVTFGTSSSSGPYQGPFGRSNDGIDVGQIYVGWQPWDWLNLTVGKMPNPLYTTPMVWSSNITPEGFAERFKYEVGPAQFFANFGQFIYADLNPNSASGGLGINGSVGQQSDNIFMLAWQGGVKYQVTPNITVKVAATYYNYLGLHQTTANNISGLSPYFGDPYVGEGAYYLAGGGTLNAPGYSGYGTSIAEAGHSSLSYPFNQVGLDHLKVIEVPFDFTVHIPDWKLKTHVFGDFAYNLDGANRADAAAAAYNAIIKLNPLNTTPVPTHTLTPQPGDVKAYQFGIGIGSDDVVYGPEQGLVYGTTGHRHSWEVRTYWQHTEQYALDPNLPDVDFFEGAQNMQGIYVAAAYSFTDDLIATFRYGHASRINSLLGTGGSDTGDIPQINPINDYDIYQMDLTLIF